MTSPQFGISAILSGLLLNLFFLSNALQLTEGRKDAQRILTYLPPVDVRRILANAVSVYN